MPSIKDRLMIVENLVKNERDEDKECIRAMAAEIFTALNSLKRIADSLEKLAAFKGIE